jgi:hypothetical protein
MYKLTGKALAEISSYPLSRAGSNNVVCVLYTVLLPCTTTLQMINLYILIHSNIFEGCLLFCISATIHRLKLKDYRNIYPTSRYRNYPFLGVKYSMWLKNSKYRSPRQFR